MNFSCRYFGKQKGELMSTVGHVHKDVKNSCLENELNTDAAVASYLQHYNALGGLYEST